MAYKSLLTIISDPGAVAPTLAAAVSLARRDDADPGLSGTDLLLEGPDVFVRGHDENLLFRAR